MTNVSVPALQERPRIVEAWGAAPDCKKGVDICFKRIAVSTYRRQRRGGRGLDGMRTKEEDWVEHLFIASTHDYVMFFSNKGQVYWLKVHEIPQAGRGARGKPVVNLINVTPDTRIRTLMPIREFREVRHRDAAVMVVVA